LKTTKIYKKMGLQKGKTNNPDGRPAGTPNRITSDLRNWIENLISKNLTLIETDLKKLEPKDRLIILERFLQYTIPKQQSISVEAQIQAEYEAIELLLDKAPEQAIDEITTRLIKLNKLNKKSDE